jgi:hypothetical protein
MWGDFTLKPCLAVALLSLSAGFISPALAQDGGYYPVFCQGISIESGDNRMFVSDGFFYPLAKAPDGPAVQDADIGKAFAQEVKRTVGKTLLDQSCFTRASVEDLRNFIASTKSNNGANWKVADVAWLPKGAHSLDTDMASLNKAQSGVPAKPTPGLISPISEQEVRAEERAARAALLAAEKEAAAQKLAEERARDAEQLRAENAKQLAASEAERRKIAADKDAFAVKQKAYEAGQQAYAAAMAKYEADKQAAADAHAKWEADVKACEAGEIARCGPKPN